jgi:hypothetical protein
MDMSQSANRYNDLLRKGFDDQILGRHGYYIQEERCQAKTKANSANQQGDHKRASRNETDDNET